MSTSQNDTTNTTESPAPPTRRRTAAIATTSVLAVGALAAGAWGAGAWGAGAVSNAGSGEPQKAAATSVVQEHLDSLVDLGFPGALASVTSPRGKDENFVAGIGDLETGAPVPVDGEVRAGSNTKTFTAVSVLQLVQDERVELDEPIEGYLPGLVRGDGIDGSRITVRQLLQHTSGLPEYTTDIATDIEQIRDAYLAPRDLLDLALAQPAHLAPGERWEYSNTNYLLLGMLIERITERPLFEVITENIIEPLKLKNTYFPTVGEKTLRGDHPKGYHQDSEGKRLDVTELDPSWGWAAGQIVASPSDLNEFLRAVLDGRLLGDAMIAEMQTTIPSDNGLIAGAEYGLGIQSFPLSCGGEIWGHGGDIHGYQTRGGVDQDQKAVTIAVTSLPWGFIDMDDEAQLTATYQAVTDAVDAAFCEK